MDPPPSSQSHFAKFDDFVPDHDAPFEDEFARLASSQSWVPGSQQYTKERTIAMRQEIKLHYFSQSAEDKPERQLTEAERLQGFQNLCVEIGIEPSPSIGKCRKNLKKNLVNIVDFIDARRTGKVIEIWEDFSKFRIYTLQDEKRIDREEAKKDGGLLASLLQQLYGPRQRTSGKKRRNGGPGKGVKTGRVVKVNR